LNVAKLQPNENLKRINAYKRALICWKETEIILINNMRLLKYLT